MMSTRIKASIIVPIYNVEKYLDQCIESLVKQTYKNLEIILVDDGATDSSGAIVDEWAKKDSRIVAIHQKNSGMSAARNVGIKESTGEYILFVDSDDYVTDKYVEELVDALEKEDADISMCKYYGLWPDKVTLEEKLPSSPVNLSADRFLEQLYTYSGHYSLAWNKAYRRQLFDDVCFEVGKRNEDARIMLFLMLKVNKIAHIPQGLYYYRQRQSSIMNGVSKEVVLRSELEWIQMHLDELEKLGKDKLIVLAQKLYFNKIAEFYAYLESGYKKEIKRELKQKGKQLLRCDFLPSRTKGKIMFCMHFPNLYGKMFTRRYGKSDHTYFE